ncbi:MAG: hypothetical protein J6B94_00095 [Lachnospiraceae bacterium]|nr:hypothetical protein [Lachnospiraceae bacterium]
MNSTWIERAREFIRNQRKKQWWRRFTMTAAVVVVFVTTYMLILPAITMERETVCGKTEHEHTEQCYTVAEETEDAVLNCELETHIHEDACYEAEIVQDTEESANLEETTQEVEESANLEETTQEVEESVDLEETIQEAEESIDVKENVQEALPEEPTEDEVAAAEQQDEQILAEMTQESEVKALRMATARAAPTDLKPYITNASAASIEYDPATGDYKINLNLEFTMTKEQIQDAAYQFTYQFPEGVIVPDILIGNTYSGYEEDSDVSGFTYTFVKNDDGTYGVNIVYDEAYVEAASEKIHSFINFNGYLDSDKYTGGSSIKFSDGVTLNIPKEDIIYPDDETLNYDMNSQKSGSYQMEGNLLYYTITVSTKKGTPDPIIITDTLTADGLTVDSLKVVSVTKTDTAQGGNTVNVSNYTFTPSSDNKSFQMSLGGLDSNQKYTITYVYELADLLENTSVNASNRMKAEAKDPETGEDVENETWVDAAITKDTLRKTGSWGNDGTITWKITVNGSGYDIAGMTVTDEMFAKLSESELRAAISPTSGYEILKDSNGKITGIKFTAVNGGKNTNTYTIEYQTEHEATWESQTVINKAVFDPTPDNPNSGDEAGSTSSVTIPGSGSVEKSVESVEALDENQMGVIHWLVKVTVPEGGLAAGTEISDQLDWGWDEDHFMSKEQILEWAATGKTEWLSSASSITFFNRLNQQWHTVEQLTDDAEYTQFKIVFKNGLSGEIYGGQTLELRYDSTIENVKDSENYRNDITINGRGDYAEYTYRDAVTKTDGDGNKGTTTTVTEDGTVLWKVKVAFDRDYSTVTITDTLPEQVTLTGLQYGTSGSEITAVIGRDGSITAGADTGQTYNLDISGSSYNASTGEVTLQVTLKPDATRPDCFKENGVFYVIYTCQVKEEYLPKDGETTAAIGALTNRVVVTTEEGTLGSDEQTQDVTVEYPEEITQQIDKSGAWNNDTKRLNYSIDINPGAQDLLIGEDTLTLIDELSYVEEPCDRTVSLIQSSVKLYYAQTDENGKPLKDEEGKLIKGDEVSINDYKWTYSTSEKRWGWDTIKNTLTVEIPDSTALIFEYSYQVDMTPTQDYQKYFEVTNVATLIGDSTSTDNTDGQKKWEESQTSGGVSSQKKYTFYKVDSADYSYSLSGAEFSLFQYNPDTAGYQDTGQKFTTEDGKLTIFWQRDGHEEDYQFEINRAYYLVETKASDGYELPADPPKYYFIFYDSSAPVYNFPYGFVSDAKTVDLNKVSRTEYVTNAKDSTEIVLTKKWYDTDGIEQSKADGEIQVQLWAKCTPTDGSGTVIEDKLIGTYTLEGPEWKISVSDLTKKGTENVNGNDVAVTYSYYVTEISKFGYDTTYENNDGIVNGTIVIKNQANGEVSYELPATGGTGNSRYRISGSMLVVAAGLMLRYQRTRRRREDG